MQSAAMLSDASRMRHQNISVIYLIIYSLTFVAKGKFSLMTQSFHSESVEPKLHNSISLKPFSVCSKHDHRLIVKECQDLSLFDIIVKNMEPVAS